MLFLTNLIGFGTRAQVALTTISQVLSGTSTLSTIAVPLGVQAGDLILLLDTAIAASAPASALPTGFTSISNSGFSTGGDSIRHRASYKLANGTEGGVSLTGVNGANSNQKEIYVFRGNVPATSVTVSTPNVDVLSTNPASQNVAASSGIPPLVVFGCYGSSGTINPRTMSPAKDAELNASVRSYLAYKIYDSSPSDVSVDMDDEGDVNALHSFYIQMA